MFGELGVVRDLVPRDVQRHARRHPRVAVHLRRVRDLLEGIPRDSGLGEHLEPRPGVAERPARHLDRELVQTRPDPVRRRSRPVARLRSRPCCHRGTPSGARRHWCARRARRSCSAPQAQPLTAPAVMPDTIFRLKKMNMISGGTVTSTMFMKSRLYCVLNWLEEVVQGELDGRVLVARQEVQRVDEVVEDRHGLRQDHGDDHRPEQREDDAEEQPQARGPVDDRRLVELPGDGGDERPEEQDGERQAERHLDEDEPGEVLEQAERLEHPDRRHDRRRDDEAGEHENVGDGGEPARDGVG